MTWKFCSKCEAAIKAAFLVYINDPDPKHVPTLCDDCIAALGALLNNGMSLELPPEDVFRPWGDVS